MLTSLLGGCSSQPPIRTVDQVDLKRFMGDWYVIAHIPTFMEDEAYNAIESYAMTEPGVIDTTFTFREGGYDGKPKEMNPTGYVTDDPSNAVWGMRFVWPFKSEYLIAHLDEAYQTTIIARNKRDYVWIMAREPNMNEVTYSDMVARIERMGYDLEKLRRVPQQWPNPAD